METFTVEDAANKLLNLVIEAHENNSHFRITSEKGNVMLLSEETYHNLIVTLELLSTPGLLSVLQAES